MSLGRLSLSALAFIAACGGRTAEPHGIETNCSDVATACESLASAVCARRVECSSAAGSGQRFATDDECRERWALACRTWTTTPDGKISTDDVTACATEIGLATCGVVASVVQPMYSKLPRCLRVPGLRQQGAACENDAQCATSFCGIDGSVSVCRAMNYEPAYDGEPCDRTTPCAGVLQCEAGRCGRSTCPPTGCFDYYASCGGINNPGQRCSSGTECVSLSDLGAGRCAPYAIDGQACGDYDGPRCLFPARCVDRVCTLPQHGCTGSSPPPTNP